MCGVDCHLRFHCSDTVPSCDGQMKEDNTGSMDVTIGEFMLSSSRQKDPHTELNTEAEPFKVLNAIPLFCTTGSAQCRLLMRHVWACFAKKTSQ